MKELVPNNNFPFITCYGRLLDRRDLSEITEYIDALTFKDCWNLGRVQNKKGLSQYVLELDIWNNEPDVSMGFTQQLFNDAKDCKILIYEDVNKNQYNEKLSFSIRNLFDNSNNFKVYKDEFLLKGNVTNYPGILKGNGDHAIVQIALNLNDLSEDINYLNFVICLQYTDQNIVNDVFFKCCINITNDNYNVITTCIGDDSGVTIGDVNGMSTSNAIIEAYNINGKLKDQQILNSNNYSLFLNEGEYNFVIKNSVMMRRFNNVKVDNGIKPYYCKVTKGLIYDMYDDIIEYIDGENITREVHGRLIDEYKTPIKNGQIIITNNDTLITNFITDEDGYYRFKIEPGIYDIRICGENKRLKIIRNYEILEGEGLFSNIKNNIYNFEYDFGFVII